MDNYQLIARLGSGGMADVFYALTPADRPVVIKLLRATGGALAAARREYRMAHAVDPDCTAPMLGCGMSAAGAYLVTSYLPGYRSGETLESDALPDERLWTLGASLARTLAAVHARGIVHCDLKPSNLLIRGDHVRLIDFGIARFSGEPGLDGPLVQCSRGWAAPEQIHGASATPAIDVFSFGCVLSYLATGIYPFGNRSQTEWLHRVQTTEPDLSGLPPGLDEVVRWTLARDPNQRPTAHEVAELCTDRSAPRPGRLARTPEVNIVIGPVTPDDGSAKDVSPWSAATLSEPIPSWSPRELLARLTSRRSR